MMPVTVVGVAVITGFSAYEPLPFWTTDLQALKSIGVLPYHLGLHKTTNK